MSPLPTRRGANDDHRLSRLGIAYLVPEGFAGKRCVAGRWAGPAYRVCPRVKRQAHHACDYAKLATGQDPLGCLAVETLADAKSALASREGISDANINQSIGIWSADAERSAPDAVSAWAAEKDIDHVVWTALKPKIGNEFRTPSVAEVLAHLRALRSHDRDRAEEYVRMAPRQIATPYRVAIEKALGWTPLGLV